jgi:AmmeMemoRadiSam system protein B/AmmeMemoRadiSam system protein A
MVGGTDLRRSLIIATILVLLTLNVYSQGKRSTMEEIVRKPAVAGQFYTADPEALKSNIEDFIAVAEPGEIDGTITAIISPHAGYTFSGGVAAYGYKLLIGKSYENVVVISPSHLEHFNFSAVFSGSAYATPLGKIAINSELCESIANESETIKISDRGHLSSSMGRAEHALEVQLPFLQIVLNDFKLIPIVMGDQRYTIVEELGKSLGKVLKGKDALIIASTDLSHFHGDSEARKLDRVFMDKLEEFAPSELMEAISSGQTEACGGGPTVATMIAARMLGANKCKVLAYANSGDVTGDNSAVVGYTSGVLFEESQDDNPNNKDSKSNESDKNSNELTRDDKIFLLKMAREVIKAECEGSTPDIPEPSSPIMKKLRGAFVTLKKNGQLRGCIGYIEAIKPLYQSVREMAVSAAFKDYRFTPVKLDEVSELEISISVLSPISKISDPSRVEVGKHGLIISKGGHRGLLLPQVPVEWNWDRETFLDQTCVKAGLPKGCWKDGKAIIEVFTANVFSEKEFGLR